MIEIIPVIHVTSREQALINTGICWACGIKKAFYINHVVHAHVVVNVVSEVKQCMPDFWVGINLLGIPLTIMLESEYPVDAIWVDETVKTPERKFKGMVFGGLAFKYQAQPTDLKAACDEAAQCVSVATTSGPGTGKAASVMKLRKIREHLGNHPLAVASGVSAENIGLFRPFVDYVLVASSITDTNEYIIPEKLKDLITASKDS